MLATPTMHMKILRIVLASSRRQLLRVLLIAHFAARSSVAAEPVQVPWPGPSHHLHLPQPPTPTSPISLFFKSILVTVRFFFSALARASAPAHSNIVLAQVDLSHRLVLLKCLGQSQFLHDCVSFVPSSRNSNKMMFRPSLHARSSGIPR